jgi:diguanylate cyclase (GGDEF)-like protein
MILISLVVVLGPMLFGLDGLALLSLNLVAAAMLGAAGMVYWRVRAEAPGPIIALTGLYSVSAISFVLCAVMIGLEGDLADGRAPRNWAETLNVFVAMVGIATIGALSLALNHARNSARHSRNARTDPLTGLMNRRALFDIYDGRKIGPFVSIAAFDLDNFKAINDTYGHAVGDEALVLFGRLMLGVKRPGDYAVRLGGEEFALVMPGILPDEADALAESVRRQLAALPLKTDQGDVACTVSVGVASGDGHGATFANVLKSADEALYQAKRSGRDRVVRSKLRLVSSSSPRTGIVARSRRS